MGPTRAGKHGGRCVGPIPGSPRSHLNGTRLLGFPGQLRCSPCEKVAHNRLQDTQLLCYGLRSPRFQSLCIDSNLRKG